MFSRWTGKLQTIEERRSMVRVSVTRLAAIYIFVGSAILIALAFYIPESKGFDIAKDIFMTVLPIGTGIVTYWFANRSSLGRVNNPNNGQDNVNKNMKNPEHDSFKEPLVHEPNPPESTK